MSSCTSTPAGQSRRSSVSSAAQPTTATETSSAQLYALSERSARQRAAARSSENSRCSTSLIYEL
jgi:hypothetical protein